MADWGPVVIAVVLFVLLTPGLLFQLPGKSRAIEFANFQTSGVSIFVHTIIYFGLITIFLIAIGVHITTGIIYPSIPPSDEEGRCPPQLPLPSDSSLIYVHLETTSETGKCLFKV
ncbi:OLC1v1011852C1 [Oldenlandia corymbosa var. corymbosa]|uniref:OLC1v1011852C1 n=1 Tax=Oldenlandia corymbosa var. corymbosa TaxID=529605 RepID=A0AAV1DUT4_OLDCO|nr:OLC1v1011852C1 [Oldenlandia corymbosa var. corymbosa]